MRHGTRQLCGKRARHGALAPATGLVLRRHVAGFYSAVDTFLYGWTESYGAAGHAVLIGAYGGCLRCGIGGTGVPHFQACHWPEGSATIEEPACGNHFTPYGAVELGFVNDLISETALRALLEESTLSHHRIWLAPIQRIKDSGGAITEAMTQLAERENLGGQIWERDWCQSDCPSCSFAREYRSVA